MRFVDKNFILREECLDFIREKLIKLNNRFEIISINELISDGEVNLDKWFELPVINTTNRYGYMVGYGITSISLTNDSLWFNGVNDSLWFNGVNEDGNDYAFGTSEIDTNVLCEVADYLLEN